MGSQRTPAGRTTPAGGQIPRGGCGPGELRESSPHYRAFRGYERRPLRLMLEAQMGHSRGKQKGSEVLEFGFVVTPMLGFTLLIIDIGWGVFTRSTLQYAVREGVRYAVTSQTATGLGQKDSIDRKSTRLNSSHVK